MLSYVKARASEFSSILSASGAAGILAAWLLHQISGPQALVGLVAAVVGYVMPQDKALAQAIAAAVLSGVKEAPKVLLPLALVAGLGLALSACTTGQTQSTVSALEVGLATAETAATSYAHLPACSAPGSTKVCSDPIMVQKMKAADMTAYTALKQAEATAAAGSTPDLTAATAALVALQDIVATLPTAPSK